MATQRIAATNVFRHGHRLIVPPSSDSQSQDECSLQNNRVVINFSNAKFPNTCLGGNPTIIKNPTFYVGDILKGVGVSNGVFNAPQIFGLFGTKKALDEEIKGSTIKSIGCNSVPTTEDCGSKSTKDVSCQTKDTEKVLTNEDFNISDITKYKDIEDGKEDDVNDKAVELFNKEHHYEAVQIFYAASRRGNNNALYNLAQCLFEGKGIPENKEKAVEIWEKLSQRNHPDSCYQLAVCLINGIGITQNRNRGIEEMEKASSLKHPEATYFLAVKNMKSPDFDEELLKCQMSLLIAASPKYENKFKQFLGYKDFPERVGIVVRQILSNIDREYNRCFQSLFIKFPF
uniref:Sel1 repeat family protein n=1 Tax=Strongyloides papillosus TaxID=174720 RepID=A0A0N5C3B3_STREA